MSVLDTINDIIETQRVNGYGGEVNDTLVAIAQALAKAVDSSAPQPSPAPNLDPIGPVAPAA